MIKRVASSQIGARNFCQHYFYCLPLGQQPMELLTPFGLAGIAGIPLWYLFFLWRQRRLTRPFSSLLIWQKTSASVESFSTSSKKWFDPLLLLPFSIITLLSLSASTPVIFHRQKAPLRIGILIDRSASMLAPHPRYKNRWQATLHQAKRLLDQLESRDRVLVLACPQVSPDLSRFLSPPEAWKIIQQCPPLLRSGDPQGAFLLAKSRYPRVNRWYLFSDGPSSKEEVISVGERVKNGAITRLSARKIPGKRSVEVMVELANYGVKTKNFQLKGPLKLSSVVLKPGQKKQIFFAIPSQRGLMALKLSPSDSFPFDNRSWLYLGPSKIPVYFAPVSQSPLYYALKSSQKVRFVSRPEDSLVAFSHGRKFSTPVVVYLAESSSKTKGKLFSTKGLQRLLPSLPSLSLSPVAFSPCKKKPPWSPLFTGPKGDWGACFAMEKNQEVWRFGFSMSKNSQSKNPWIYQVTFPLFWNLFLERLEGRSPLVSRTYRVGKESVLALPQWEGRLLSPSGKIRELQGNSFVFRPTELGTYTLFRGMEKILLPVNFTMEKESDLRGSPRPFTQLPQREKQVKAKIYGKVYLLFLALALILLYWWIRQKKEA